MYSHIIAIGRDNLFMKGGWHVKTALFDLTLGVINLH